MKNAYFLSHNGLGDNLYSIGALRFLLKYYKYIYFLCCDRYIENVKLFFQDTSRIICISVDSKNEIDHCKKIMDDASIDPNNDIFICGFVHKSYLQSRITDQEYLEYKKNDNYTIDFDTINKNNYHFIEDFYEDIGLDLSIFFKYWNLPSTEKGKELYNKIKNYYIVFLQTTSSDNKKLNIQNLINKYLYDENKILICNDKNMYKGIHPEKEKLASYFVMEKIVYYLDVIKKSQEIYIIDSCFIGLILPLKKRNELEASIVRIILRDKVNEYPL
jgi:hypothetical protein